MKKIIIGLTLLSSISAFADELLELHSSKPVDCSILQQRSFNAVENFIKSNNINGNYTAVAVETGLLDGCRLLVTLQNSDYKLLRKDILVYGPSIWEHGTIAERLAHQVALIKKSRSYVVHTVSKFGDPITPTRYEIHAVSMVHK